jgi:hypothetical protein
MSFLGGWVVVVAFSAVALGQPVKGHFPEGEKKATPERNQPARTDLYGVPLPADALTRMGVPHFHGLYTAWSPDGKVLALGGGDGVIHLWDLKADKLLRRGTATLLLTRPQSQISTVVSAQICWNCLPVATSQRRTV